MDKAKIRLSAKEAELVGNAGWILTKNAILQKAKLILEDLQSHQQDFFRRHATILPNRVMDIPPKISKGENYKGLPYLVLDYPRLFEQDNHFAVRSMFWWGNFFSITLHLSGTYKITYQQQIENLFHPLHQAGFFIGINEEPWEHHFESSNYSPVNGMSEAEFKEHCNGKPFLKLAKRFPLEQWEDAGDLLMETFESIIEWLKD